MNHIDKTGGKSSWASQLRTRWQSPLARLYVDHAVHLVRQGRYVDLLQGVVRTAGRTFSQKAKQWKNRTVRLSRTALAIDARIDAKRNRLTTDGIVVEKMSITFPSATAPLLASIVVPCFNYGRFVGEAVESALSQTVSSLEVIVVDDGSTEPDTHEALVKLECVSRVRVVRQDNAGLPSARNTGIALATGEYICCLDADDTLEATYLEMAIAIMEADRSVGFAYSWAHLFGDESSVWQTRDFDLEEALIDNQTSVAAVFRRDDWIAAGGFRPDMRHGYEDWEFWLRLSTLGRRGRVLRTPLFNHRRHGRTMTHDAHAKRQRIMNDMRRLNPTIFDGSRMQRRIRQWAPPPPKDSLALFQRPDVLAPHDNRRHLLLLVPWLGDGGAEILLLDLLEKLADDWRTTIVTSLPDQQPWWSKFANFTSDIVPLTGAFDEEVWLPIIDHLISTRGSSILLSHGSAFAYSSFAALKRLHPQVAIIDILHNDLPSGHLRNAVIASDHIDVHIAISERIARSLKAHGIPDDRITTIQNGVDIQTVFTPNRYDRASAKTALCLPPDVPALVWIGRLAEEKRPKAFINIIKRLATDMRVAALMIGAGELDENVDRAIKRARLQGADIRRIPHLSRSDMGQVYAAADFLVLTSSIEGMPFVALEAMACGCPVAATDVGDIRLLVVPGETGYLAKETEPLELAVLLKEALGDPARMTRMRVAAREKIVASPFCRHRMQAAYSTLFEGVRASKAGVRI